MSKIGNTIGSILRGSFLGDDRTARQLPFAGFVTLLAIIAIYSAHSADRKVHRINQLEVEVDELESEHLDTKSRLMQIGLESQVEERVEPMGLKAAQHPPTKLIVKDD